MSRDIIKYWFGPVHTDRMTTGSFRRKNGRLLKADDWRVVAPCHTHEDWFTHSEWVAEFWCTVSMLPLGAVALYSLYVGEWLGGLLALHATLASAAFHAAPFRRLLRWDQLAAGTLMLWSLTRFQWSLWPWYVAPLAVGVLDAVARRTGRAIRGLHPIWHCAGPISLYVILSFSSSTASS